MSLLRLFHDVKYVERCSLVWVSLFLIRNFTLQLIIDVVICNVFLHLFVEEDQVLQQIRPQHLRSHIQAQQKRFQALIKYPPPEPVLKAVIPTVESTKSTQVNNK